MTIRQAEHDSIHAFYDEEKPESERMQIGLGACEELLRSRDWNSTWYPRELALCNESYYLQHLQVESRGTLPSRPSPTGRGGQWVGCNPSVVRINDTLHYVIRHVNYVQNRGRWYESTDTDRVIRTKNLYMQAHVDTPTRPVVLQWIDESVPDAWPTEAARIWGLEDVRLFSCHHMSDIRFTATSCQRPRRVGRPQIVMGTLSLCPTPKFVDIIDVPQTVQEKNHLGIYWAGEQMRVYSWDPFVVQSPLGMSRVVQLNISASTWRGSAGPIEWIGDSFLALVHEVARRENSNIYSHRWVVIGSTPDGRLCPSRYSDPFVLDHHGIEYAAGLAQVDPELVLVTYGYEDREPRCAIVRAEQIEKECRHECHELGA